MAAWKSRCDEIARTNRATELEFRQRQNAWSARRASHAQTSRARLAAISVAEAGYQRGDRDAIASLAAFAVEGIDYPFEFEPHVRASFDPASKLLVMEYDLPSPDMLPTLIEVRYVKSTGQEKHKYLSDGQRDQLYDSLIYQIVLLVVHRIFRR